MKNNLMDELKKILGIRNPGLIMARDCRECAYHKTMKCPNSKLCYDTWDKPYFKVQEE